MISQNIKCKNCGFEMPAEETLIKQAEEKIKLETEKIDLEQSRILNKKKEQFEKEKREFEEKKAADEILHKKQMEDILQLEKIRLKQEAVKETEDKSKQIENENAELKQRESTLAERVKELLEKQEEAEIGMQKKLLEENTRIENETRKKEHERYELLIKEYDKKIADLKQLIEEMKKKAEMATVQKQEEVKGFSIADLLRNEFPYDDLKSAANDPEDNALTQTVRNEDRQDCGLIVYMIKHEKAYSEDWIQKIRADQQNTGAALAVLAADVLPEGISQFGCISGVWICKCNSVKALAYVLREMLIREYAQKSLSEKKDMKTEQMNKYLSSDEFKNRVESIVSGFKAIKAQTDNEKLAMQNIWVQREKQIGIILENTVNMYGTVKGIGGKDIKSIQQLELDAGLYTDDNKND